MPNRRRPGDQAWVLFDGHGIDVRVCAGLEGDDTGGFAVSGDLHNFATGCEDATLPLTVSEGHTLDEVGVVSVWCVAAGVSFGDGLFQ